jgi:two-component system chemotaxis response regulator CheY
LVVRPPYVCPQAARALVVDDSRAMRTLLTKLLMAQGFDVIQATDGSDALRLLGAGPLPAVVLIDWTMPVMDGLTLLQRIRRQPDWRHIALMMVTTHAEHSHIVRALAAGAHEYLVKPFGTDTLVEKLDLLGLIPAARARP